MRRLRRGAPFGWLLALLLPLLVSGGLGGTAAGALLNHPAVAKAGGEHQPSSRQVAAGGQRYVFTAGVTGVGTGAGGGGHPYAAPPPTAWRPSPAPGPGSRLTGDDDSRSLAALLVRPGRAPPSTGG
ncbi:hypothetical protein FHS43_006002 [Streptosporangium becharense]|uniref:Uncharacterized protein n=1 Tax=Streptosporangium becharense TaxID=1816182 RepID=A0A7W9IHM2_9ACTN|nr:hypothetical protein [Streptosporangium becharense]MBB2914690.1 hypothetical protein [Streptosporangium becharense]MBB5820909.1 hypothetical protein [Streptosporangium becharense]